MTEKQEIQVVTFDKEQYDGDWPPTAAAECIAWFQAKVAEIPAEHQGSAKIEIESAGGYEGSHKGKITISYSRIETDEEAAQRAQKRAQRLAEEERRLVAQLERVRSGHSW